MNCYYLHTNGSLIFKRRMVEKEPGGFVREVWPFDPDNREMAYRIVLEAFALGASRERVEELAKKWGMTDDDCLIFAALKSVLLWKQGKEWFARVAGGENIENKPTGRGPTAVNALMALWSSTTDMFGSSEYRMV